MFRYCSSFAFVAMLAFGCASKNTGDDGANTGAGGGPGDFAATGGDTGIGGEGSGSDRNMTVITQEQWDAINKDSCSGWTAEGEMIPAMIYFIVDTSGSMLDVSSNTSDGRSKWDITNTALKDAIATLPRMTSAGLLLWPNMMTDFTNTYTDADPCAYCDSQRQADPRGVGMCVNTGAMVGLAELGATDSDHRHLLNDTLDAVSPKGGTPMADAYNYAIDNNFGDPLMLGKKYAVLITDGQPTIQLGCMGTGEEKHPVDYTPVLQSISGAYTNNHVNTFVIGSPGSEKQSLTGADGRFWLSEAARTGGTPLTDNCDDSGSPSYCHFDMSAATDFASGFSSALKNITGQLLSCTYQINETSLEGQKVNPDKVNVVYQANGSTSLGDMKLIGKATTADCPEDNGWYIENPDDPNNKTVQLCPATCAKIQQDAGAVVNIRGGCDTLVVIN